jgi:hypothetical protein
MYVYTYIYIYTGKFIFAPQYCIISQKVYLFCVFFRRNIDDEQLDKAYLKKCQYSSDKEDRLCPIIKLKTIFDEISDTAFDDAAVKVSLRACTQCMSNLVGHLQC